MPGSAEGCLEQLMMKTILAQSNTGKKAYAKKDLYLKMNHILNYLVSHPE